MVEINFEKELHASNGPMYLKVSLSFPEGSFVSLTGPSGSGKSSLFRMISGLMKPDKGTFYFDDTVWFNSEQNINVSTKKRNIGFLFQDYALFPNMTVLENLEYAAGKENAYFVEELIRVMDIEGFLQKNPYRLSGGQQQRVALARALVRKPRLLLLDEPLSALDIATREKIQFYLKKVLKQYKLTVLMVSHNAPEIIRLSDYVYLLKEGEILKSGTTKEFFGNGNSIDQSFYGEIVKKYEIKGVFYFELMIGDQIVDLQVEKTMYSSKEISDKIKLSGLILN